MSKSKEIEEDVSKDLSTEEAAAERRVWSDEYSHRLVTESLTTRDGVNAAYTYLRTKGPKYSGSLAVIMIIMFLLGLVCGVFATSI